MAITKKDVERSFREHYLPAIKRLEERQGDGGVDGPMRREEWNNYVDALAKDGEVPQSAYNWAHPRWLESKMA